MDAASGAQVSTVRGAAKHAFGWTRAGVRLFILSLIGALIVVVAREWDWWVGSARAASRMLVGISGVISGKLKVPDQAARSIC